MPTVVWAITLFQFSVLVSYTVLLPVWRSPDEPQHADLVLSVARGNGYPSYDASQFDSGIIGSFPLTQAGIPGYFPRFETGNAPPRSGRPSFGDLASSGQTGNNYLAQHPPLYYIAIAALERATDAVLPADQFRSFDRQVWQLRVLSSFLFIPLPVIGWLIGTSIGLRRSVAVSASMVPLCVPGLIVIGAAVTNDTLLILLSSVLMLLIVRLGSGQLSRRLLVTAGVVAGLTMLTKGFGMILAMLTLLAVVLGGRRAGRSLGAVCRALAIVSLVAVASGGWWWIRNLLLYGELQPSTALKGIVRPAGFRPDWWGWLDQVRGAFTTTFWGNFGWYEAPLPTAVVTLCSLVSIAGIIAALFGVAARSRRAGMTDMPPFSIAMLLLAPVISVGTWMILVSANTYRTIGIVSYLGGRYLYPGALGAGVLAVAGVGRARSVARWLPALCLGGILAVQLATVVTILDAFWGSAGASRRTQLGALRAWSPLPLSWLIAFGLFLAVALGWTLVVVGREVRRSTDCKQPGVAREEFLEVHGGGYEAF